MKKKYASVDWDALLIAARQARGRAYAPYSRFRVGAAILGESGRIHAGCNVENSSYGLTICAERNAVAHAIAEGEDRFLALVIVAGAKACPPCGMCRQFLAEFSHPDLPVLLGDRARKIHRLGELLPHAFDKSYL